MDAAAVNAMGSSSGWMTRCKIELNGRTRKPPLRHPRRSHERLAESTESHTRQKKRWEKKYILAHTSDSFFLPTLLKQWKILLIISCNTAVDCRAPRWTLIKSSSYIQFTQMTEVHLTSLLLHSTRVRRHWAFGSSHGVLSVIGRGASVE